MNKNKPCPLPLNAGFGGDSTAHFEMVETHRRDECGMYQSCLSRASVENWRGWSCIECRCHGDPEKFTHRLPLGDIARRTDMSVLQQPLMDIVELLKDRPVEQWTPLVVTDEGYHGAHVLLSGTMRLLAARILKKEYVIGRLVSKAHCPICREKRGLLWEQSDLISNGYCPSCKGFLLPQIRGIYLVKGQYKRSRRKDFTCHHPKESVIKKLSEKNSVSTTSTTWINGNLFSGLDSDALT